MAKIKSNLKNEKNLVGMEIKKSLGSYFIELTLVKIIISGFKILLNIFFSIKKKS